MLYTTLNRFCRETPKLMSAPYLSKKLNKDAKTEALFDERSTVKFLLNPHIKD